MKRDVLLDSLREFLAQNGVYDLIEVVKEAVENEADPTAPDASEGSLCYNVDNQLDSMMQEIESIKARNAMSFFSAGEVLRSKPGNFPGGIALVLDETDEKGNFHLLTFDDSRHPNVEQVNEWDCRLWWEPTDG